MVRAELRLRNQRGVFWAGQIGDIIKTDTGKYGQGEKSLGIHLDNAELVPLDVRTDDGEEYIQGSLRDLGLSENDLPYRFRLWLLVEEEPIEL